jgi:hypothetical protein
MSTSTDDFRRARNYIFVAILTTLLLTFLAISIPYFAIHFGYVKFREFDLFDYQIEKLRRTDNSPYTIFVGDSSLGNSIDAAAFSKLSGQPAVNLALTGAYGLAGSYNMIRRAIAALPNLRNVVVEQTPSVLTRQVSLMGYYQTLPTTNRSLWTQIDQGTQYALFLMNIDTLQYVAVHLLSQSRTSAQEIVNDYIAQSKPITVSATAELRGQPNQEQLSFLKKIVNLCHEKQLNCVFAFGPVHEAICRNSTSFLHDITTAVEITGIRVVKNTPVCIANQDIGDSDDHIRENVKAKYTRKYFDIINPYLKQPE